MVEAGAVIERSVVRGPAIIGANARIIHAYVGPFTSIMKDVEIRDSEIEHSIVLEGSKISNLSNRVEDSLIGKNVTISRLPVKPSRLPLHAGRQFRSRHPLVTGAGVSDPTRYAAAVPVKHPRIDGVKTEAAEAHSRRARLADGNPPRRRRRAVHAVRAGLRVGDVSRRGQGLALPPRAGGQLRLRRRHGQAGARRHARRIADEGRRQRVLPRHRRTRRWCRCPTSSTTAGSASAPRCRSS